MSIRILILACAVTALLSGPASAQRTTIIGRVLNDSGVVLVGAEAVLNGPPNVQRTNDRGEFRFPNVPAGRNVIGVRMPGYAPKVDTIDVADAGELRRDFKLARVEIALPEVPVRTTPLDRKLAEFRERRRLGIGRFLDSAEFANTRGTRTSDRLAKLPGVMIQRGRFNEGYVTNTRQQVVSGGMCRSLVWLDGVNLGTGYNVNELDPSIISAIEWYAGQASIPMKYAVPSRAGEIFCGVLVIWLR